jgi:hypothetical protein
VVFQNNLLMGAGGQPTGYDIDESCRFNDNDSAYLYWRPSGAGDSRDAWSLAIWFKRCNLGSAQVLYDCQLTDSPYGNDTITLQSDNKLDVQIQAAGGSIVGRLITTQVFRDPSAWQQLVVVWDSADSTAGDRLRLWINGSEVTAFDTDTQPSSGQDSITGSTPSKFGIAATAAGATFMDGYLTQVVFIDGTSLTSSSFGETNSTTGQWVPIDPSDLTFGSNGFLLDFSDSTFLGKDARTSGDQVNSYASSQWGGATGSYTFSDGRLEADTDNKAIKSDDTFAGDFELQWQYKDKANWVIGVYETGEDGTFDDSNSIGGMASMTDSWYIQASSVTANNDIKYGGATVVDSTTIANGDVWNISRSSGTLKIERNGSTVHTWSQTSTNTVRIVFAQGDTSADAEAVNWVDNSTLGNNFFSSGLAAADQMTDSPTNNVSTLNPLGMTPSMVLSDGNLVATPGSTNFRWVGSTISIPPTGKWVFEAVRTAGSTGAYIGIGDAVAASGVDVGTGVWYCVNVDTGNIEKRTGGSNTTVETGSGDLGSSVIRVEYNADDDEIQFFDDGSSMYDAATAGLSPQNDNLLFLLGPYATYSNAITATFNEDNFAGTPTSDFKGLSTSNFSSPTIANPSDYFNVDIYTGTGESLARTGIGFQPNLLIDKSRSNSDSFDVVDSVRGVDKYLYTDGTAAEETDTDKVQSFDSDGYTLGTGGGINSSGRTYVAWLWKESTTPAFDIVSYDGTGSIKTESHGLGVVPDLMIIKNRNEADGWVIYHQSLGATQELRFSSTVPSPNSALFNDTAPTSSVFTVGTSHGVNGPDEAMIAYVFAEVEGFSKIASYVGNGNADGPFVWCGFRPSFLLWKSVSNADDWNILDDQRSPYNVADLALEPNTNDAEVTGSPREVDLLSNGFKIRGSDTNLNGDGHTLIFWACAETPFKTANAR